MSLCPLNASGISSAHFLNETLKWLSRTHIVNSPAFSLPAELKELSYMKASIL
jgi:hypothetical protein